MPRKVTVYLDDAAAGQRLDRVLAERLAELSRSRIQTLMDSGAIVVNGRPVRASTKAGSGDVVQVILPDPEPAEVEAEDIPLDVVYEDEDLLVLDKPAGLVVHPAPGHPQGTLVNALLARISNLEGIGGQLRPGIVHRLDKDTSGLMVVAKNEPTLRFLQAQLKHRAMDKRYLTLVDGGPQAESGTIDAPVGRDPRRKQQMAAVATGREAVTHFRVLRRFSRHTFLECKPVTGRTHQIRVHLAAIGYPVSGDRVYGSKKPTVPLDRHFLHAARLTFQLPGGETRTFERDLPPDLRRVLDHLSATA